MRGRWQAGEIVSTNALGEELHLSRTPVLQALKRLESNGLVEAVAASLRAAVRIYLTGV